MHSLVLPEVENLTASLVPALGDPTKGEVLLDGRDIRSFLPKNEPGKLVLSFRNRSFLRNGPGTVDYWMGNSLYEQEGGRLEKPSGKAGLQRILSTFDKGLDTEGGTGESISLGQRQLIAFMRAVLQAGKSLSWTRLPTSIPSPNKY